MTNLINIFNLIKLNKVMIYYLGRVGILSPNKTSNLIYVVLVSQCNLVTLVGFDCWELFLIKKSRHHDFGPGQSLTRQESKQATMKHVEKEKIAVMMIMKNISGILTRA